MLDISNFKNINKKLMKFPELNECSKKAIVWRWAIDCENNLKEKIAHLLTENVNEDKDLSNSDWENIILIADEHFKNTFFLYFEVPTKIFTNIVLSKNNELKESFNNWNDYSTFYGTKDVKKYSNKDRWPVLAPIGDPEIIEDGWHRLHSYVNYGHETIPVIEYGNSRSLQNDFDLNTKYFSQKIEKEKILNGENNLKFFHGTSKKLWNKDGKYNYLFLTRNIEHAKYHAKDKSDCKNDEIIIEVDYSDIIDIRFEADDDLGNNPEYKEWFDSFSAIGSFVIVGENIPTNKFKVIELNNKRKKRKKYE